MAEQLVVESEAENQVVKSVAETDYDLGFYLVAYLVDKWET